jgi:hypothetical protein
MNTNGPTRPGIDAFHRERSKCVDAFSELESAVIRVLMAANIGCGGESFGQKLSKLIKAKASSQLSKASLAKLPDLLQRCESICTQRNDIVHSRMQLAILGDEHRACFVNTQECENTGQTARLFSLAGLRDLSVEMGQLAEEIRALVR